MRKPTSTVLRGGGDGNVVPLTRPIKRGDCYGTILVNLETGQPLDLLADRTAEAVLPWLENHQEIEVVSRDRASAYADAVRRALPHAIQVADRYHLVQNLREHVQRFFDRKCPCLPEIEDIPLKAVSTGERVSLKDQAGEERATLPEKRSPAEKADQPTTEGEQALGGPEIELPSLTYAERKKKISRDKRYARYEHLLALHQAGMSGRAIARELHMYERRCIIGSPNFLVKSMKMYDGHSLMDIRGHGCHRAKR